MCLTGQPAPCTVADNGKNPRGGAADTHMKMTRSLKAMTWDLDMMGSARPCAYGLVPAPQAGRYGSGDARLNAHARVKVVKFSTAFVFNPLSVLSWSFEPTAGRSTITRMPNLSSSEFGPMPLDLRS